MKQTATEWLFEQLWNTDKDKFVWHSLLEQAKEMFEQQIIDAYKTFLDTTLPEKVYKEYYQEKFKSE